MQELIKCFHRFPGWKQQSLNFTHRVSSPVGKALVNVCMWMCVSLLCSGLHCLSAEPWSTCKWWILMYWQGESWPSGFDPARCQSSSPSVRSRRTLSWVSHQTWYHLTRLASQSCPTTVALKEIFPPLLIHPQCHLWMLPVWVHHGNNAKGEFSTC